MLKLFKNSFCPALSIILFTLSASLAFAWTEPALTPPSGNISLTGSQWTTGSGLIYYNTGNVGVGTTTPTSKLEVNGLIYSGLSGFKFPDGTIQTTAGGGAGGHGISAGTLAAGGTDYPTQPSLVFDNSYFTGQNDPTHGATFISLSTSGMASPSFSVYRTANQNIANVTFTKVQWTSEEFDSNNNFDSSTNYRFTPTVAGNYHLETQILMLDDVADTMVQIYFYKNGSPVKDCEMVGGPAALGETTYQCSGSFVANGSTDYFEVYIYQASGGTMRFYGNGGALYSRFSGWKIDIGATIGPSLSSANTWTALQTMTAGLNVTAGNVGIGTTNPIHGNLEVRASNVITDSWGNVGIITSDAQAINKGGTLVLGGTNNDAATSFSNFGVISGRKENATTGNFDGYLSFATDSNSANAAVERMRITSTGNVGIGTTNPGYPLEVATQAAVTGTNAFIEPHRTANTGYGMLRFYTGAAEDWRVGELHDSTSNFYIADSGNNVFLTVVDNGTTGNVGIGTTDPQAKLMVKGGSEATAISDARSNSALWIEGYSGSSWGTAFGSYSGQVQYIQGVDRAQTTARQLVINPFGGNVGIGTTVPLTPLHVAGEIRSQVSADTAINNRGIEIIPSTYDGSNIIKAWSNSGGTFTFASGSTGSGTLVNKLIMDPSTGYTSITGGNVGIGTTNPLAELHIKNTGDGYADGIRLEAYTGNYYADIHEDTGGPVYFTVNNGSVHASLNLAGAWTNASDISIKKDIVPINYGLDTVMKLQPRSYNMKSDNSPQIGFVAQEMEKVIPEVVSGKDGFKGISYGQLTAVLAEAIQELNNKIIQFVNSITQSMQNIQKILSAHETSIQTLENTVSEQQKQIDDLEAKLAKLEAK